MAEVSQNGWPASPDPAEIGVAPCAVAGVPIGDGLAAGPATVVLAYVAEQVHQRVEPLAAGTCWGYKFRPVTGGTELSNHASGTAVDLNAPRHPLGQRGTFTAAQVDEIHAILAEVDGVVRWGGDYSGRVDEMHFEINADPVTVARVAARLGGRMTRIMYDSITAKDIPTSAQMVAGYANGTYAWSAADWARFPHAVKVRIATRANINDGHVLDVEPGDSTPAEAVGWVQRRRAAGVDPTVYCNQLNNWSAVRKAFVDARVPEPHYWVARYDNNPTLPAGAVAKQYANPTVHGLGHFDLSIVANYWPGIDQPQEDDMSPQELLDFDLGGGWTLAKFAQAFQVGELGKRSAGELTMLLADLRDKPAATVTLDEAGAKTLAAAIAVELAARGITNVTPAQIEAATEAGVRAVLARAAQTPGTEAA